MADHIAHSEEAEVYATGGLKDAGTKDSLEHEEYEMGEHHEAGADEYGGEYGEYDDMGDVEMDQGAAAEYEDAGTNAGSILATQDNGEHQLLDESQAQAGEYYEGEGEDKAGEEMVDENGQVLAHQEQMYDEQGSHMYDQNHVDAGSMDYSMIASDAAGNSSLDALSQVISSSVGHLTSEMSSRGAHTADGAEARGESGQPEQDAHDSAQDKDRESSYGLNHSPSPGGSMQYKARVGGDPLAQNVTPIKRPHSAHSGDGSSNSRLKSKVWNWYDILADGHRQCRFCAQKYGRLTATTILARHYHNRHDVSSPAVMTPTAHRTSHHRQSQQQQQPVVGHGEGSAMTHMAISQAGQTIYSQAAAAAAVAAASAAANRNGSPDAGSHLFHSQTNGDAGFAQNALTNGTSEDLLRSVSEAVHQHEQGQYENNQLIIQDGFSPMITSPLTNIGLSTRRAFAAVAQFCAQGDMNKNLQTCLQLIGGAARRGARMVFLPEASDFIAENRGQAAQQAQALDGAFMKEIQQAAKDNNIWVSLGVHEQPAANGMPYNTNAVVSDDGTLVAAYRKLHLFDVNVKDGPRLLESASTSRGQRLADVVDTPVGKLGLSVCYDLRFPEMAQALRARGAQLLSYPSAFTEPTGAAHWEVLLRARAVETQTYVFAAAQIGRHSAKRTSYGDAMVVDPWGVVVARCPRNTNEPTVALAEINLDYLEKVRREMPVFSHKRSDIFPDYST